MRKNTAIDIFSAVIIALCLPVDLGIHIIEAFEATWTDIKEQWRSRLAFHDQP